MFTLLSCVSLHCTSGYAFLFKSTSKTDFFLFFAFLFCLLLDQHQGILFCKNILYQSSFSCYMYSTSKIYLKYLGESNVLFTVLLVYRCASFLGLSNSSVDAWQISFKNFQQLPHQRWLNWLVIVKLNEFEIGSYYIQLSQNLTLDCLFISVFLPVFT